jgi:hypothetical protein
MDSKNNPNHIVNFGENIQELFFLGKFPKWKCPKFQGSMKNFGEIFSRLEKFIRQLAPVLIIVSSEKLFRKSLDLPIHLVLLGGRQLTVHFGLCNLDSRFRSPDWDCFWQTLLSRPNHLQSKN